MLCPPTNRTVPPLAAPDTPADKTTFPPVLPAALSEAVIYTEPDDSVEPEPLDSLTSPPRCPPPAAMETLPPLTESDWPAVIITEPPSPPELEPLATDMTPGVPSAVFPVATNTEPEDRAAAPLRKDNFPLDEEAAVSTAMPPPVLADAPLERITSPPSVSPEPAAIFTPPPVTPDPESNTKPPLLSFASPAFRATSPEEPLAEAPVAITTRPELKSESGLLSERDPLTEPWPLEKAASPPAPIEFPAAINTDPPPRSLPITEPACILRLPTSPDCEKAPADTSTFPPSAEAITMSPPLPLLPTPLLRVKSPPETPSPPLSFREPPWLFADCPADTTTAAPSVLEAPAERATFPDDADRLVPLPRRTSPEERCEFPVATIT